MVLFWRDFVIGIITDRHAYFKKKNSFLLASQFKLPTYIILNLSHFNYRLCIIVKSLLHNWQKI